MRLRILLLGVISLLLAACGGAGGQASPTAPAGSASPQALQSPTAAAVQPSAAQPTATPGVTGPAAGTPAGLRKVTLALGYIPNVQFAPFYLAAEKGYYRQEGLDVEFRHGIEPDLLKLVGSGNLKYAVASGDELLVARSQGVPLVYVGAWYQKYPVALITPKSAGITDVRALKGKTVGVPGPYGATYTGLLALLSSAGMTERDIKLRSIGFTQVQALQRKQVDAVMGYANNEPLQLERAGVPVNTINVWEHADLVSNGLITNEQNLKSNRDEVAALVRATMRGIEATIANPEAGFQAALKYVPEAGGSNAAAQMAVLKSSAALWQNDASRANGTGYTDPAAWRDTAAFLQKVGVLKSQVDGSGAYTNELISAAGGRQGR